MSYMFHCVGSMRLLNFCYPALLEKLETWIHQRYQTQLLSGAGSVSFFTSTHCLQTWSEVCLTFLPLVSHIFGVSDLIDPSVILLFHLFSSSLNSVQSWHWDIQWVWWEHSISETFSLFSARFHLPLLHRKCSSTCSPPPAQPWGGVAHLPVSAAHCCPGCSNAQGSRDLQSSSWQAAAAALQRTPGQVVLLHTTKICLKEGKNTVLHKCYWEQTQSGKSTSSVPLLIFFKFNI